MLILLRYIIVAVAGVVAYVTVKDLITRFLNEFGITDTIWNTLFTVGVPI
jgi:hypothetical protein